MRIVDAGENANELHKRPQIMDMNLEGKVESHPQPHLLLNVVSVRQSASDWGPKKGDDGANCAQQADLVLCSAAMDGTTATFKRGTTEVHLLPRYRQ